MWEGRSRQDRAQDFAKIPLQRYSFPRPFAISKLPTRDITMQSVPDDDGEFRLYQGVWRLQPLPGCTPGRGMSAMRLTYAVEGAFLCVCACVNRFVHLLMSTRVTNILGMV